MVVEVVVAASRVAQLSVTTKYLSGLRHSWGVCSILSSARHATPPPAPRPLLHLISINTRCPVPPAAVTRNVHLELMEKRRPGAQELALPACLPACLATTTTTTAATARPGAQELAPSACLPACIATTTTGTATTSSTTITTTTMNRPMNHFVN
ncbi:hypothetical protein O3P69_013274 [Scylla paramamosain]|uniref:Uncharacterized protein n=1 Tax=Scylla paramamosain TaxID=85552 RepID=A0AAW0U2W9_SCYPA